MKILNLLSEGVIKVPETALKTAVSVVLSEFFSRVPRYIKSPAHRAVLKKRIEEYKTQYEDMILDFDYQTGSHLEEELSLDFNELPNHYKPKIERVSIRFLVGEIFTSSSFYPKDNTLIIKTPSEDKIKKINENIRLLDSLVTNLISTVEHELMHVVQHYIFGEKLDASVYYKNASTYGGQEDDDIDHQKYYQTDFEFQPNIVTNAKYLISQLRKVTRNISSLNIEEIKKYITQYTSPKTGTQFYREIYKKDPNLWKRAVKETYTIILKEIHNEKKI